MRKKVKKKIAFDEWIRNTKKVIPYVLFNGPSEYSSRPCLGSKRNGAYSYITYRDLREKVSFLASALYDRGLGKNDNFAILSENREEWIVADLGAMTVGAVVVPIYPNLTESQVGYIFKHCEPKFLLVSGQFQYNKAMKVVAGLERPLTIITMEDNLSVKDLPGLTNLEMSQLLSEGQESWPKNKEAISEIMNAIREEDVCSIIYTSGTTNEPKGVMLTHENFVFSAINGGHIQLSRLLDKGLIPKDLIILPLAHVFARMVYYSMILVSGASVAFAENFNTIGTNLREVRPNVLSGVPRIFETIYNRIISEIRKAPPAKRNLSLWAIAVGRKYIVRRYQDKKISPLLQAQYALAQKLVFSKIREFFGGNIVGLLSAGAKLNEDIGIFYCSVGLRLTEGYGLTETSPTLACTRPDDIRWGSVGQALPGVTIKIAADGEILAKGPNVMKGYYKNEEATREAIDPDGWFHTGDLGEFNTDGFLRITGRKKEILVLSTGKNITPSPIESLLNASPFIEQAMLVGDDSPYIAALIVPKFDTIKSYLQEKKAKAYAGAGEMVGDKDVRDLIDREIKKRTKNESSKFEQIKKFVLLDREFTIEKNELTPTLKFKRRVIYDHFAKEIAELYEDQVEFA